MKQMRLLATLVFCAAFLFSASVLSGCSDPASGFGQPGAEDAADGDAGGTAGAGTGQGDALTDTGGASTVFSETDGYLRVHFIDVGQGDSILIQAGAQAMLVDAGTNESGSVVTEYLRSQNITRLDYLIGTHPHEDHIGGLDDVIRSFEIGTVIMPDASHTTKTYEDVLDALLEKSLTVTLPHPGDSYSLGDASFTILSPSESILEQAEESGDMNNLSVGIRLAYGSSAFVLCGDAESASEEAMAESGLTLKADVLKAGHHGSSTSTCDAFLSAVDPDYAVISCGRDNSYGHPHQETLDKLNAAGVSILRTDEQGTLVAVSDGKSIVWSSVAGMPSGEDGERAETPGAQTETAENASVQVESSDNSETQTAATYVLNQNTLKFHLPDCSSVAQMKEENRVVFEGTRDEAIAMGYSPCGQCRP